jgi:hypothetical protein
MIYLIGSLRNPEVPKLANRIRETGFEVFDDWYSAGPEADDKWRDYEKAKGHSFIEGLSGEAAKNVFNFDKRHIEASSSVILALPAGKSGHLELGWALGLGKRGYILLDSPERWDIMYQFATAVFDSEKDLIERLKEDERREVGPVLPWHESVCLYCLQGPLDENGRCNSCGEQFSFVGGL